MEDLAARVKAAKTEKEYKGAGTKVGIEVWRVEKLNIKKWPVDRYGEFYDGDSYIVLHTRKEGDSNKLLWDVYFWLGSYTSQDEMGVAAYKTVELDDLLGTAPVQHREVQGFETTSFVQLFKKFNVLSGGIESGFNITKPEEFKPKLLQVKGKKNIKVFEVPFTWKSLNVGDVFILDNGLTVYIWLPKGAGKGENFKANQVAQQIKNSRKGVKVENLDSEGSDAFWKLLGGGKGEKLNDATSDEEESLIAKESSKKNVLFRLSDESGKLEFKKVAEGDKFKKKDLDTKDVFIADLGDVLYVWVGKGASENEKKNAIFQANKYLGLNKRPAWIRVTRVLEGQKIPAFDKNFA